MSALFNVFVIGLTALIMVAVGVFDYVVDPYDVYGALSIKKFNQQKPELSGHGRLAKAIAIEKQQPKILILGSSRTELGINPDYLAKQMGSNDCIYNGALDGAYGYELFRYFEHALAIQPNMHDVFIGLDLQMFDKDRKPPAEFDESRLNCKSITYKDAVDTVVSMDALLASLRTVWSNFLNPGAMTSYFHHNGQREQEPLSAKGALERWSYSVGSHNTDMGSTYDKKILALIARMHDICVSRQIHLHVFISPAHALEWERFHDVNRWQEVEQWKRELAQITGFWDFSGYNSITTEPLSGSMKRYTDASHYRDPVGRYVVDRMLGKTSDKPSDFGVWCDKDNVETVLSQINQSRAAYIARKPNWYGVVLGLKSGDKKLGALFLEQ